MPSRARDVDDLLAHVARGGRHRDQELVGAALRQEVAELVDRPEHADAVEAEVLLARVVVDEPDRGVAETRALEHLADGELRGVSRADDDDLLAARDERSLRRALDQRAREEAGAGDEREQEERVDDPDPTRHLRGMEVEDGEDEEGGDDRDDDPPDRLPHVARGDVAPPPVVEAERDEDREHDPDDERDDVPVLVPQVVDGRVVVEANEEREPPRGRDEDRVDRDLPQPMSVERASHALAGTPSATRTVSTTRSCMSGEMPAQSGIEKFSSAARSVSGRSPVRYPR